MQFSGARLKHLRLKAKMTHEKLASAAGISYSTLRNYEAGRSEPPVSKASQLASALQVEIAELMEKWKR